MFIDAVRDRSASASVVGALARRAAALLLALGLLAIGQGLLAPREARADALRLRSGKVIQVQDVEVVAGAFRLSVEREGELSRIELSFDQLEPRTVLRVFDRCTNKNDPQLVLQGAQIALALGLSGEAKQRFARVAEMEAGLEPEVEAGLVEVEKQEASQALVDLEDRLRKSRKPVAELAALEELLTGPHAGVLTPAQRTRIQFLIRLAAQVIAREQAREDEKNNPPAPPKKPDDATPPAPPEQDGSTTGRGRTYADERYRNRFPHRRGGPAVPGTARPPSGASGGTPRGAGGSTPPGGAGGGSAGGSAGGSGSGGAGTPGPGSAPGKSSPA